MQIVPITYYKNLPLKNRINWLTNISENNSFARESYSYECCPNFKSNMINLSDNNDIFGLLRKNNFDKSSMLTQEEEKAIKKAVPVLEKLEFSKSDYDSLSAYEKCILRGLIKKNFRTDKYNEFSSVSIKEAFNIIYKLSSDFKTYLDTKYSNNYKLVGIGSSPDPFITVMSELGADAITVPFSAKTIRENYPHSSCNRQLCKQDWENYFAEFGLNKEDINPINKKLVLTDFVHSGISAFLFRNILIKTGFDENKTDFLSLQEINKNTNSLNNDIFNSSLYQSTWKKFSKFPSAKDYSNGHYIFDTENFKNSPETLLSKLFSFALYEKQSGL